MAVTMIALYKEPADREKFEKHYFDTHIPLVKKIPGLQKVEVSRFTGKDAPYYLMATLYFNSKEERKAGLSSPEGQATNADLVNFATPDSVTIAFTEIV
ncbi:EthD family reductase [Dictyobacter aurantiacus]|uniref:Putative ethyl tert-butyl ether degradation protein EthD n=1 Tax=Dictyobacter aurantiacus TaxID=1936993 RepID=A0A401ZI23_9CHLR|nr:EthD family reductase [Dictyobacter aurantiacus]GCE06498.1 putative ethyl tert-butyl ether degradation protein EthD [Dictyobacter aurantiacus]